MLFSQKFACEVWDERYEVKVSGTCVLQLMFIFSFYHSRLKTAKILTTRAIISEWIFHKKYLIWKLDNNTYQLPWWKVEDFEFSDKTTFQSFLISAIQWCVKEIHQETWKKITHITSASILENFEHTSSQSREKEIYATIAFSANIQPDYEWESDNELKEVDYYSLAKIKDYLQKSSEEALSEQYLLPYFP